MIIFDKNLYVSLTRQKTSHISTKIALKPLNTNLFNIVLLSIFLTIGSCKIYSQDISKKTTVISPKKQKESPGSIPENTNKSAAKKENDTIKKDSIKVKVFLDGKVKYKSVDYARIDQKKKLITLYDKAELYYQDIELKSGIIVMDYEKNEVYAGRIKDSTGAYTQYPNFKQGANVHWDIMHVSGELRVAVGVVGQQVIEQHPIVGKAVRPHLNGAKSSQPLL